MPFSTLHNIIFDLDGLIVDTEPLHQRALNSVLQVAGADHYFETAEYGEIFTGKPIYENAEYLRERFGLPQTAAQLYAAHRALFDLLIADADNLEPMPGLGALFDWLGGTNVRQAVASSSRPEQIELILRGLNRLHHFAVLVGNDGTLKPKPSPDVYLLALERLGAQPDETVALEDSSSGVRAARNAGLFVIAVPNVFTQYQDFSAANLKLENLHQVKEWFQTVRAG